ncbi:MULTISPECIES: hypothetical protein [Acidianus]|uniref:Chromosome assembly protein n=1 Tax=Candidatus Acidianus copahuensis TaxID=1160895 RepID=A0A031LRS1_9CREN|nr:MULTISPECIES: hypothetical protein [Acidianus]EZQ07119.1 hypothetical protein CM19_06825 [Candidatus Acidianus copahuensis]NON62844.1 hypothetical protein [Acidianus sp. RZ1]
MLKSLNQKDVRQEIQYLELQQKKLEATRAELEKDATKLFNESIGKSEATKRLNATKIKNIKDRIADIDKDLKEINLRLGVLYKIDRIKEKAQKTFSSKVWAKIVNDVDSETLERWLIDERMSEDQIIGKLRQIYNAEGPQGLEDQDVSQDEREILSAMTEVEKGERKPEEVTKEFTKEEA